MSGWGRRRGEKKVGVAENEIQTAASGGGEKEIIIHAQKKGGKMQQHTPLEYNS